MKKEIITIPANKQNQYPIENCLKVNKVYVHGTDLSVRFDYIRKNDILVLRLYFTVPVNGHIDVHGEFK